MQVKIISGFRYMKMDLYRAFFSWKFLLGILGVFSVMLLATIEIKSRTQPYVLDYFFTVSRRMIFMIIMVFGVFPYARCFCEDYEHKYINLELVRGNLHNYTLSKVITVFITSVMVTVIGMLLYVLCMRCFLPWLNPQDTHLYQALVAQRGVACFLGDRHYFLYYFLYSLQFSMIVGDLALLASYVSLYISNRLLVLAVPFMSFYLINYIKSYIDRGDTPTLNSIFLACDNFSGKGIMHFYYAVGIGLFSIVLLSLAIYGKLKRRIRNE